MLEQLLELDTELFLYLNALGSTTWDWLWLGITNKLTFIPLYAILLFLIYRNYGLKPLLLMVLVIATMITFTRHGQQHKTPGQRAISELQRSVIDRYTPVRSALSKMYGKITSSASLRASQRTDRWKSRLNSWSPRYRRGYRRYHTTTNWATSYRRSYRECHTTTSWRPRSRGSTDCQWVSRRWVRGGVNGLK